MYDAMTGTHIWIMEIKVVANNRKDPKYVITIINQTCSFFWGTFLVFIDYFFSLDGLISNNNTLGNRYLIPIYLFKNI